MTIIEATGRLRLRELVVVGCSAVVEDTQLYLHQWWWFCEVLQSVK